MICHKCNRQINEAVEDVFEMPFFQGKVDWLAGSTRCEPVCEMCWDEEMERIPEYEETVTEDPQSLFV